MFKTIVVPIDGSTGSERVLLFAEHLARRDQAQIIVVHAYELPEVYGWTDGYAALAAEYERVANEVTQDAVEALQTAGVQVIADVRQGRAADMILDAVRVHQADLVVMGSRGQQRDTVAEALLGIGSVSNEVLSRTYCPVLVVP